MTVPITWSATRSAACLSRSAVTDISEVAQEDSLVDVVTVLWSVGCEKTINLLNVCNSSSFPVDVFCSVETLTVSGRTWRTTIVLFPLTCSMLGVSGLAEGPLAVAVLLLLWARDSPRLIKMSSAAVLPWRRVWNGERMRPTSSNPWDSAQCASLAGKVLKEI